jgi:hypothetical protein
VKCPDFPVRRLHVVGFGKVGVIGAIERKGNVVARVIGSMDAPTLGAFVRRATDEKGLSRSDR